MKEKKVVKAVLRKGFGNAPIQEVMQYASRRGLLPNIHVTTEFDLQKKETVQVLLADSDGIEIFERKSNCFC